MTPTRRSSRCSARAGSAFRMAVGNATQLSGGMDGTRGHDGRDGNAGRPGSDGRPGNVRFEVRRAAPAVALP